MNKLSVILTVIISYFVLAGGVATPFPPCHLALHPDPACCQPFLTRNPGYTTGWRGPLFGTAPHQACLKPVKLVFMMPGRSPFPGPRLPRLTNTRHLLGPSGQVLRLLHPQICKTVCRSARPALPHTCSDPAPRSSSGRLTRSCRKSLLRTRHSRLFTHIISPPIFHAKRSKQGPEGFPALPSYTVSSRGWLRTRLHRAWGAPSAHSQGSCSQGCTSRPVVKACFLFAPTSPCGRRLFPQPQ